MSTTQVAATESSRSWQLENDLPSVACQAAIELDNLIIGRSIGLEAAKRLSSIISQSLPSRSEACTQQCWFDPTTAVAMHRAITDTQVPLESFEELLRKTGEILGDLGKLGDDPNAFKAQGAKTLPMMRAFCLALSKHASALQQSFDDQMPDHPFRR